MMRRDSSVNKKSVSQRKVSLKPLSVRREFPTMKCDEPFNPEDIPRSMAYDNKYANEKLAKLRDDIRRNKIFHKEYQIHLDPGEVVKQLGKGVYDPGDQVYIPENEEGDLTTILVPIHDKLNQKAALNVKEDAKPLYNDEEGQQARRDNTKRQTKKLDQKDFDDEKRNRFDLVHHNKAVAQYRLAEYMMR